MYGMFSDETKDNGEGESGISWSTCKLFAFHSRQIITSTLHFSTQLLHENNQLTVSKHRKQIVYSKTTACVLASQAEAIVRTGKTWPQATKQRTGD